MIPLKIKLWAKSLFPTADTADVATAKLEYHNDMKYQDFVLEDGRVVCNTCRDNCGQCGSGLALNDLQARHDALFVKK
ncbi:hypothetical protein D3C85_270630 [compost metagenome]